MSSLDAHSKKHPSSWHLNPWLLGASVFILSASIDHLRTLILSSGSLVANRWCRLPVSLSVLFAESLLTMVIWGSQGQPGLFGVSGLSGLSGHSVSIGHPVWLLVGGVGSLGLPPGGHGLLSFVSLVKSHL